MDKQYKIVNGTSYDVRTSGEVIEILESCRIKGIRIRIFYGSEGHCWNEENDMIGTIGRSTGDNKVTLLIKNKNSIGGNSLLDHCVVRIDAKAGKRIMTMYKDPTIEFDHFLSTDIGTVYNQTQDRLYARCNSGDSGKRLAAFMNGERWSK
jgi:hypothetical protein